MLPAAEVAQPVQQRQCISLHTYLLPGHQAIQQKWCLTAVVMQKEAGPEETDMDWNQRFVFVVEMQIPPWRRPHSSSGRRRRAHRT